MLNYNGFSGSMCFVFLLYSFLRSIITTSFIIWAKKKLLSRICELYSHLLYIDHLICLKNDVLLCHLFTNNKF